MYNYPCGALKDLEELWAYGNDLDAEDEFNNQVNLEAFDFFITTAIRNPLTSKYISIESKFNTANKDHASAYMKGNFLAWVQSGVDFDVKDLKECWGIVFSEVVEKIKEKNLKNDFNDCEEDKYA